MKSVLVCLAGLVLALPAVRAQVPPNPLSNGGFEAIGADGFPTDWSRVGERIEVTDEACSGLSALLMVRTPEAVEAGRETGLNRAWQQGSGDQGAMLAERQGGLRFRYKILAAPPGSRLTMNVIPMNAEPKEGTGLPRAQFHAPASHAGDGIWHEGVLGYDFTASDACVWAQVSPRLTGPAGASWILDDVEWVESVGPVPAILSLAVYQHPNGVRQARCLVGNVGDAPLEGKVDIALPAGLTTSVPLTDVAVRPLPPGAAEVVVVPLEGAADADAAISAAFVAGDRRAEDRTLLVAALSEVFLQAERAILSPGMETDVEVVAWNRGTAPVPRVDLGVVLPDGLEAVGALPGMVADVAPNSFGRAVFRVRGKAETPLATIRCRWSLPGTESPSGEAIADLVVGADPEADGQPARVACDGFEIVFPRNSFGYGIGWIRALPDGRPVGAIPALGRLRLKGGPEAGIPLYADGFRAASAVPVLGATVANAMGEGITFRVPVAMPGAASDGPFEVTFAAQPGGGTQGHMFTGRVTAPAPGAGLLLGLDAPAVCAGEGAFAGKTEALVPGIEWLLEGEMSSSDLDIAYEHPHRLRWRQHPHLITIPFMSVRYNDLLAAVLWHPRARWNDGGQRAELSPDRSDVDRPTAVFASPDRFAGRRSHTLGLAVPTVPEYVAPNASAAAQGWPPEGSTARRIDLSFSIFVRQGSASALDAMRAWFDVYGVVPPRQPPRTAVGAAPVLPAGVHRGPGLPDWALAATVQGAWAEPAREAWLAELDWSMGAYLKTLWDPEAEAWLNFIGGPAINRVTGPHANFLDDCLNTAALSPDADLRQALLDRVATVRTRHPNAPVPQHGDLEFRRGNPIAGIVRNDESAMGILHSQPEDGGWRFQTFVAQGGVFKGKDYAGLGYDGYEANGLTARKAWTLLRAHRLSGEPKLLEAGLKSLAYMEKFRVPRAAQVWEVIARAPDILAAADACEAYLEGYLLTGERKWLDLAVYWAATGIPFLYQWDVDPYPWMRYGSIPIFGSTWWTCTWFGRPVQWNGLRWAYAALKLAEYDNSYPWRTMAAGVTVSAMYQQETDPDTDRHTLWPDVYNAVTGERVAWDFAPVAITKNVYALLGYEQEPRTVTVSTPGGPIGIHACARVNGATHAAGSLLFTAEMPPPLPGSLLVTGVTRPLAVVVNGVPLAAAEAPGEPGWHYDAEVAALAVSPEPTGTLRVVVGGVRPCPVSFAPRPIDRVDFDFRTSLDGWRARNDLSEPALRDGILHLEATGGDPYLVRTHCRIDGNAVSRIKVRLAVSAGTHAQFFWGTAAQPSLSEARKVEAPLTADGTFQEITFALGDHPQWRGQTITTIRLDPMAGAPEATIRIDWIRGE